MVLPFAVFFGFTFALLPKKRARRIFWVMALILACIFSLLLAYASVTSVWRPYQMQDDVARLQNALGEYEGVFPRAKLSYPLYLNVFHTPADQWTSDGRYDYGQVQFSMFIANLRVTEVDGIFWLREIEGPTPLHYKIDLIFLSDPETFYVFLIVLFTIFNVIGALLGMVFAEALRARILSRANSQEAISEKG